MAKIFLTYHRNDASFAHALKEALEGLDAEVILTYEPSARRSWSGTVGVDIARADLVVVFWSCNSVRSMPVLDEASHAKNAHKLFSILIENARVPLGFTNIKGLPYDVGVNKIAHSLLGTFSDNPKMLSSFGKPASIPRLKIPSPQLDKKFTVFVSHASADKNRIGPIIQALIDIGFEPWIDRPKKLNLEEGYLRKIKRIRISEDWQDSINKAIAKSDVVICFWSHDSVDGKRFVFQYEVFRALVAGKLFQGMIDQMTTDKIGTPYTFMQVADLSDFDIDANREEFDLLVEDIFLKAGKNRRI